MFWYSSLFIWLHHSYTIPAPGLVYLSPFSFRNIPTWSGIPWGAILVQPPTIASIILLHLRTSKFSVIPQLQTESMNNTALGTCWQVTHCMAKRIVFITLLKHVATFPTVAEISNCLRDTPAPVFLLMSVAYSSV